MAGAPPCLEHPLHFFACPTPIRSFTTHLGLQRLLEAPPRGPRPAWLGGAWSAAPSMAAQTTRHHDGLFSPDSPVGSGALEGRDQPWVPSVPSAEPGILWCSGNAPEPSTGGASSVPLPAVYRLCGLIRNARTQSTFTNKIRAPKRSMLRNADMGRQAWVCWGRKASCLCPVSWLTELSQESAQQIPS